MEFVCKNCNRQFDPHRRCSCGFQGRERSQSVSRTTTGAARLKELDAKFLEDLDAVFSGKHEEFGDHLRGMLFELWARAQGDPSNVKELEELRKWKKETLELRRFISSVVRDEVSAVVPQLQPIFEDTIEDVMAAQFRTRLVAELDSCSVLVDGAFAQTLERTLESGISSVSAFPDLKVATKPDKTQEVLHRRLKFAGLFPPSDFPDSQTWKPVFLNTESGECVAFSYDDWQKRWPLTIGSQVRVSLAWDGIAWLFPNPRPVVNNGDISSVEDLITILVDGVEQPPLHFGGWLWNWHGNKVASVSIPTADSGKEIVEARYRIVPEPYRA